MPADSDVLGGIALASWGIGSADPDEIVGGPGASAGMTSNPKDGPLERTGGPVGGSDYDPWPFEP